jgi:aminomethyltransferase
MVVNASNIEKDYAWLEQFVTGDVDLVDRSDEYGLIALQGPRAEEVLQPLTATDLPRIGFYWFSPGEVAGVPTIISRTGYTGEDGFELYIDDPDGVVKVWDALMESGSGADIAPVGLGARDSLRLEVGYNLYGNDIWEETNPLEARMGWTVKLDKGDFIGRDALLKAREEGLRRRLVGLELSGKHFPRQGYPIFDGDVEIGQVTSGTVSPTLGTPIAMGYVTAEKAEPGTVLSVDCRGRYGEATVVRPPFYKEGSRK